MTKQKINILNIKKKFISDENFKIKKKDFFIGPWCLEQIDIYDQNFQNVLNLYSPNNISKFEKDINFLKKNYQVLLKILCRKLNNIHKKKFKSEFWEILIGRWLYTWINQTYFRWEYLKKINKKFIINEFISEKNSLDFIIPENTQHAHYLNRADNYWNEFTFQNILKFLNQKKIKLKVINLKNKKIIQNKYNKINYPKFAYYRNTNNFFFHNIEINLNTKIKFQKYLGLISLKYMREKTINNNNNLRDNLTFNLSKFKHKTFTNFLIYSLKFNFPKIYLEKFSELEKIYSKSKWPQNINFIITSYGQYYDELFKLFVVNQKEKFKKTKYCMLQHGYGNIFSKDNYYNIYLDKKISDLYLTWGNLKTKNILPFFYTRLSGNPIESFKFRKQNKILLLTYSFSGTLHLPPDGSKNGYYINQENLKMIFNLNNDLKKKITKDLYIKNQNISDSYDFEKKIKYHTQINFIDSKKNFLKIIKKFNLFIHTFFGTPFFECMALNKPSIIIFNKQIHQPFNNKFKKYINKLEDKKILFKNEYKAAEFINKNYTNLNYWWNDKNLQKLRNDFCYDYCFYANKEIEIFNKSFNLNK